MRYVYLSFRESLSSVDNRPTPVIGSIMILLGYLSAILVALPVLFILTSWVFPSVIRTTGWVVLRIVYRYRVYNTENIPKDGPAIIVCNHTCYIDWLVMWVASPRRVNYLMWAGYYRNPFLRIFLFSVRDRCVKIENREQTPHAIAAALAAVTEALNRGEVVLLYPEGRLSRNGQMLPFGRGIERIVRKANRPVPVIPACAQGLWGGYFSHKGGRIMRRFPRDLRRPVSIWFGKPMTGVPKTAAIRAAVVEAQADLAIRESDEVVLVPRWFARTAGQWRNLFRPAFVDVSSGTERTLTFGQGLVAAWCLASRLKRTIGTGNEPIGVWLPTGLGAALANFALGFLRRTSVNLNYTSGRDAVESAVRQSGLRVVITAKRFEAKLPFEVSPDIERLYLEDLLATVPKWEKALRFLAVLLLPAWLLERFIGVGLQTLKPDDLLTIIFSSGSTGEPKGVMLSNRNISSNANSFYRGVDLERKDRMLACLPFFHSFGYTVCLWAPGGIGMLSVYYPDARSAKEVGELCKTHSCSILLGTATFLRFYLRRSGVDDFRTLRLIICGAEKLPVKLAEEFHAKFGVLPLEGYGCTEVSPVVSTNLHDTIVTGVHQKANMPGTVGQPIPGVAVKTFHAETCEALPAGEEGILGVKGPNVMVGYLHQPEKTKQVVRDGWYMTGDIGRIEPEGFIRITGRQSRFAKIAGEMIPLERLEEELQEILGTGERVVTVCAVADDRRGERLIVLYLQEIASRFDDALKTLSHRGLPNLWIPDRRDCHEIEAFPALGSGKLDLKAVAELAAKRGG